MIRDHVSHLHHAIDRLSRPVRGATTLGALVAAWSLGRDVRRPEGSG